MMKNNTLWKAAASHGLVLCLLLLLSACRQPEAGEYPAQVHFTGPDGQMDIPAALFHSEGSYHLFYLQNETGGKGSAWGHAVSSNLMEWKLLPTALPPGSPGSLGPGCVVADAGNTSGLGTADNPPWVALFTYTSQEKLLSGDIHAQAQGLAYSLDKGNTWTAYRENPVLPNPGIPDFHSPKAFWYEPGGHWVMALTAEGRVRLYTSPDLIRWTYASDFGYGKDIAENVWERPDLFELSTRDGRESRWIMTVSIEMPRHREWVTGFFAGTFDGKTFATAQASPYGMDYGKDHYGGTTCTNLPGGRRVWTGWMNNREYAGATSIPPWRGAFTIPRELHLEKTPRYCVLASQPVEERSALYGKQAGAQNLEIVQDIHSGGIADLTPCIPFPLAPSEIRVRFRPHGGWLRMGAAEKFGIRLSNREGEYILAGYDAYHEMFYIDRTHSTALALPESFAGIHAQHCPAGEAGALDMQIILDTASLELFALDGKAVLTDTCYPSSGFSRIEAYAENGKVYMESISVIQLLNR
jgi:fructan beta-fructosidase